jgi:hypothetical protein
MTIILMGAAVYVGLVILVLALLRACARRDLDEPAWMDRQGPRGPEPAPEEGAMRSRGGPGTGGPRSLMVVRHPSSGLRPVIVDVTPRARARSQAEAPDPA